MKTLIFILSAFMSFNATSAEKFNGKAFAKTYFEAWSETQKPNAKAEDIEHYLKLLKDDIGHQHLPYDPEADRAEDNKDLMREGMTYYLGAHTDYSSELLSITEGLNVVIIKYAYKSQGVHPQTKEAVEINKELIEVLEIEDGLVSVIRKY